MTGEDASDDAQRAMRALASKLEETVSLWRARLRPRSEETAQASEIVSAESDLRAQLAGLEQDAVTIQADLEREHSECSRCEQEAMNAVERHDDAAAREALTRQAHHAEAAEALQAELTLLRAMQRACRDVIENVHYRAQGTGLTLPTRSSNSDA